MRVKIRADGHRLFLPVPLSMVRLAVRVLPERAFEKMRARTPEPYRGLITKENLHMLAGECVDALKRYRHLEVIHVEASDGTFVSVTL